MNYKVSIYRYNPDTDDAPSDRPNMIRLEDFEEVVSRLSKIINL